MKEKIIPKKYMLVLQRSHGGQEAVEIMPDGKMNLIPIKAFTDEKLNYTTKKNSRAPKNTLAFYDAITNRCKNYDQFLGLIDENIYPFNYKINTSYIGFLNNKHMDTLKISFDDSTLAEIARNVEGYYINDKHPQTIEILTDMMDMLEDLNCDFFDKLCSTQQESSKEKNPLYDIPPEFVKKVNTLRISLKTKDFRCKNGYKITSDLEEDISSFKKDVVDSLKSYKVFREIYRFRKGYLLTKEEEKVAFEQFREEFEEERQKEYPRQKQKIKTNQIPGQISLFD